MKFKDYLKTLYYWRFRKYVSYSQTGEDLIAAFYFGGIKRGFYVDVGANDPVYLNNTYHFYKKGWRGICIEPNSQRCQLIKLRRSGDQVINAGVSQTPGKLDYYNFNPDTISTFSPKEAEEFKKLGHTLLETKSIATEPLSSILAKHANGRSLDLLSVDTEGMDYEVLLSNDWEKYRPKIIIVEVAEYRGQTLVRDKLRYDEYLSGKGYLPLADTYINGIYIDKNFAHSTKLI